MAFKNLNSYLKALKKRGELLQIDESLDPVLEIAALADKLMKRKGPAALLTNVVGSKIPVAINIFGTEERTAFALECRNFDELAQRLGEYVDAAPPVQFFDKLKMAHKIAALRHILPVTITTPAPCQEVLIDKPPFLDRLPVLTTWPQDGGPFITLPLVFTKDPDSGIQNCGMYRMQVFNDQETGMHFHLHKDAMRHLKKLAAAGIPEMEVAVAIGCDPAVIYSATAPLPPDVDEMLLAGFIRGAAVEMTNCRWVDLQVPAQAEIILEGTVSTTELREEGPFGDHTGFYSLADMYPVFRVKGMTMRENPIYPATIVGPPPMEDCWLGKMTERFFLPLLKKILPEIVDMDLPIEGIFHNFAIVSIDKQYPGQARKVMSALWGMGQMMFMKCILIVDGNVDVHDYNKVFWYALNCIDPGRDTMIVEGPVDCLDHASPLPNYGTKIGIDATTKLPTEGHTRPWPDRIVMDKQVDRKVEAILHSHHGGSHRSSLIHKEK